MNRIVSILAIAIAASLTACSTTSPRVAATPLRLGMSSAELLSAYGHPISIQHRSNGAEDWFYTFGSQQHESHPIGESTVTDAERSFTAGHATSTTTTMTQFPIHLSPSRHVIAPLPSGSLIVE